MDPIATARYGLMAATQRFETSATQISNMRADEGADIGPAVVESVQAEHAFSANLTVVRFAQEMWDSLLRLQAR